MIILYAVPGTEVFSFAIENGTKHLVSADIPKSEILEKLHAPLEGRDVDEPVTFVSGAGTMRMICTADNVHIIRVSSSEVPQSSRLTMECRNFVSDRKVLEMWSAK